jgi:Tol biopolymer transport system component
VRRRLPHIAEARIEIEDAISAPASVSPAVATSLHRQLHVWPIVAVVSLLTAAGLAARLLLTPALPEPPVARFDIAPPPGAIEFGGLQRKLEVGDVISPDGRTVAFLAAVGGTPMIWVRSLDSTVARALSRTENAGRPVWSPDSKSLAFVADKQVRTIPVAGGPPTVIATEDGRDLAWSPEGVILIGGQNKPLLRVSQDGGEPTPATELGPNETTHDYPHVLPAGRHFIYLARRGQNPEDWDVYVGSLDSKERRLLRGLHAGVRYSRTGHLLFSRGTALMAQPFDVDRQELTGDAVQVADGISAGVKPAFSISTDGSLAFLATTPNLASQLAWYDRNGRPIQALGQSGEYDRIRLSRDNRYVAFDRALDIVLFDIERGTIRPFVSNPAADFAPVWSPDDTRVAFSSSREPAINAASTNIGAGNLYERAVGGVPAETVVFKNDGGKTLTDWSRDGRYLAYTSRDDVWALPLPVSGGTQPLHVTESTFAESGARFSPDAAWIAYQSTESAAGQDVWVQSFPDRRARMQVSVNGGSMPRWSRDGKELFYVAPDGTLTAVSVTRVGANLIVGSPKSLFSSRALQGNREYEVADDGRFLLNVPVSDQSDPPVTVIVNWAATLKK